MRRCRSPRWVTLLVLMAVGVLWGCPSRKPVPFGLEDAGAPEEPDPEEPEAAPELPVGQTLGPDQVEVPVGDSALVLQTGYALAALRLDLDGAEPLDAIVVSADAQSVRAQAAFERPMSVVARPIDSFMVPPHCKEPAAEIRQLSASLVAVRVVHQCETGPRVNLWVVTIEAQPRVRERITLLPENPVSKAPIELELGVEDRDEDSYEDVVAEVRIGGLDVPLTWLNRPGGFARDASQPEAAFRTAADDAWAFLDTDPSGSQKRAIAVLEAFAALCRESGAARIGLSGTQGIQCGQSPAVARAVAVAIAAAIQRGRFVHALELQRWWNTRAVDPSPEERALVQAAWQRAKASVRSSWRRVGSQSARAELQFTDDDTLVVHGSGSKSIDLTTGEITMLTQSEVLPPIRSPDGRFVVRSVRATCAGFEAEIGPALGKRTHRASIERRLDFTPCRAPIDRPASVVEWAVLGWAPQGLLAGSGDMLRVIPLDDRAKPAGRGIDLDPGKPLPAPIRGARITPDGGRYVIPHPEGVVLRDWREGESGLWLRPEDWDAIPGELRSVAISPNGKRVAVQKGNEIRVITW